MIDPGLLSCSLHILLIVKPVERNISITDPFMAKSVLKETEKEQGLQV